MTRWLMKHPYWAVGTGLAMGLLVAAGMLVGVLATRAVDGTATFSFPETHLHASATDSGKTFAMATGPITDGVEGIFFIDFLTGELQCYVINGRSRQLGGMFKHNVVGDLQVVQGKQQHYLIVTGAAPMTRGSTGMRPADCLVYVADANTGRFAVYGLPFNRNAWNSGGTQALPMVKMGQGSVRNIDLGGP